LIELSKVQAPALKLYEFNYLFNKAINQYINRVYNMYDINQQTTDDLRVLKSTAFLTPKKVNPTNNALKYPNGTNSTIIDSKVDSSGTVTSYWEENGIFYKKEIVTTTSNGETTITTTIYVYTGQKTTLSEAKADNSNWKAGEVKTQNSSLENSTGNATSYLSRNHSSI